MASLLTDLGEEWMITNNLDGLTIEMGLYDDSVDDIADSDDIGAISTEPSDGNYSRQSVNISASDISGNWGVDNDSQVSFDVTNTSGDVDSYFFAYSFQAQDTGDSSPQTHLVATGSLSQSYALSNLDTLDISSGTAGVTVD